MRLKENTGRPRCSSLPTEQNRAEHDRTEVKGALYKGALYPGVCAFRPRSKKPLAFRSHTVSRSSMLTSLLCLLCLCSCRKQPRPTHLSWNACSSMTGMRSKASFFTTSHCGARRFRYSHDLLSHKKKKTIYHASMEILKRKVRLCRVVQHAQRKGRREATTKAWQLHSWHWYAWKGLVAKKKAKKKSTAQQ